jgi:hypothetical protein
MNGGARWRNGSGLLLLGFHARDKVEGEAVHEVGGVEAVQRPVVQRR